MYLSEIGGWAFSPKVLVAVVVLILTVVIYVVLEEEYERRTKNICVRGGMLSDLFFWGVYCILTVSGPILGLRPAMVA
jgi:hypothetical protein